MTKSILLLPRCAKEGHSRSLGASKTQTFSAWCLKSILTFMPTRWREPTLTLYAPTEKETHVAEHIVFWQGPVIPCPVIWGLQLRDPTAELGLRSSLEQGLSVPGSREVLVPPK